MISNRRISTYLALELRPSGFLLLDENCRGTGRSQAAEARPQSSPHRRLECLDGPSRYRTNPTDCLQVSGCGSFGRECFDLFVRALNRTASPTLPTSPLAKGGSAVGGCPVWVQREFGRDHMRAELPLAAMAMVAQRQRPGHGLVCHLFASRNTRLAFMPNAWPG